ncbi:SLC13 family permease [Paracoccus benzoatiresistens]|uniref:SLC13 family permease n=1 Tax=Paracoccus benzoatiresistens TaxID=2997341 RepID=A0ABT4J857_9RHOB|nr:SLC13 family permease [Paracoccus sp. EF6]MCZ0962513.1 SLC13 family permease [Paracoccus sp. EF6]
MTVAIKSPRLALALHPRQVAVAVLALATIWAGLFLPGDLERDARLSLIAVVLAILGWTGTRLPESFVALAVVLGLVLTGTLSEQTLFSALGNELIWLLLAAFVIAAVLKDAGLTERLIAPLLRRPLRFDVLSLGLTLAVAATAFVLPSTSGRAALLMPVFLGLAAVMPDAHLVRPLALIFPTAILLSAGGSLIGAGAHLLAAESIRTATGLEIGYGDWALLGLPLGLIASLAGTGLILALFAPRALRGSRITVPARTPVAPELAARQRRIGLVLVIVVGLWLTAGWHGIGMATVALIGALVLLTRPFTPRNTKDMFRAVDIELLLYMAATVLLAQALTQTGADRWLAGRALAVLPEGMAGSLPAVVSLLSVIAVLAHLVITSRSARAAVLIPAVALPMAGLGHDGALLILVAVMGTGFCQTLTASAKPVAIFASAGTETFTQRDLLRLALPLMPVVTILLIGFALAVWPAQLAAMRG